MSRAGIDYGIDLGTTNSSVARLMGTNVEVFESNEGQKCTPSAVWMDRGGRLHVGSQAYNQLEFDSGNAFTEFKLRMGKDEEFVFQSSSRRMRPEELSAEVLKSLKGDVRARTGEEVQAAVITVPAAFELPQCEATKKAAEMAGITQCPLLQEPVAAALAYGFESTSDKVFWLVFDFGGGTFDAAVVHMSDGMIQIANHLGDNHLGGKYIDWAIVEKILVPAVEKKFRVKNFARANPEWRFALARLKYNAEQAKIRLSRSEATILEIPHLFLDCPDFKGATDRFEYELCRTELEPIFRPLVDHAISVCRRVLAEKRLSPGDVEKLLLVGGPTQTPYFRDRLADSGEGLGIPLEFRFDPMTGVVRGAAIFAGTQRLESAPTRPATPGHYGVELEYQPMSPDPEPLVGGRVVGRDGDSVAGFSIEFVNAEARPPWRSGKLGLSASGTFTSSLWAEKGRLNKYQIELFDASGAKVPTEPDSLSYTVSTVGVVDPPLTHNVGIALANDTMRWFLLKGTSLPARVRHVVRTVRELQRGQSGDALRIPVLEGQSLRPNRNFKVGELLIHGETIARDVPAGQEVEITIDMDRSRILSVRAYVPILDEEFQAAIDYQEYRKESQDPDQLRKDLEAEKQRLEAARKKAVEVEDKDAQAAVEQIDRERTLEELEASVGAAGSDADTADMCENRLSALRMSIDAVEDALERPSMVSAAHKEIEVERSILNDPEWNATSEDKTTFSTLEAEIHRAIDEKDDEVLRRKLEEMDSLGLAIVMLHPGWWVGMLDNMEKKKSTMRDPGLASTHIEQGRLAISPGDVEALKSACRQLSRLLPPGDPDRKRVPSDVGDWI